LQMAECMKSLVSEMAAKHDELCHLKSQISALDEVIITARQKLLLKDQCIAQLHQQVRYPTYKVFKPFNFSLNSNTKKI